jgi:hypothetical protein
VQIGRVQYICETINLQLHKVVAKFMLKSKKEAKVIKLEVKVVTIIEHTTTLASNITTIY